MRLISYNIVNKSAGKANVNVSDNKYRFEYPCTDNHECTNYELTLSPGIYTIELYGASGGHDEGYISLLQDPDKKGCIEQIVEKNVECVQRSSMAGAGGYTKGEIKLKRRTKAFLSIGGHGIYGTKSQLQRNTAECYKAENMMRGGYNGGASSAHFYETANPGSGSGGGATDLRIGENDLYHRIIVSGGGGGTDNKYGTYRGNDDGSSGAGGGLTAQGYFINGNYNGENVADQISGFSFGNGQAPFFTAGSSDRAGAGGGWFGGFTSNHANGGAGGGSSFALTKTATIPTGKIQVKDEFGTKLSEEEYAFDASSEYTLSSIVMAAGVWDGHGVAIITCNFKCSCNFHYKSFNKVHLLLFIMVVKN